MVDRVAPDGSWVSFCAPASNHPAPLTLSWSDGNEESIAAVLGQSANGDALAIAVGDTWQLVAVATKKRFDLTRMNIDRRLVVNEREARSIVFHPTRPLVALLLRQNGEPQVLLLDYCEGSELTIRPLSREVFRMAWDPSGDYLLLDEIVEDSNGNQKLDWPAPQTSKTQSFCGDLAPRFVAAAKRGDRLTTTLVPRSGGDAVLAKGALLHDGAGWLGLTEDHGIAAFGPDGKQLLTPANCDARPVAAHGSSHQLLVGCLEKGRLALGLVTTQKFRSLGLDMPYAEDFERRDWRDRFLPIYSGTSTSLVDFVGRKLVQLNERDQLLAQQHAEVVLRRGATLIRRNLSDGSETLLASGVAAGARVVLGRRVAWVDPYVVSADPTSLPQLVPRTVAALSEEGCALTYAATANPPDYPRGPMRWLCGSPSAVDKALTSADTVENRESGSMANASSTHSSTSGGRSGRNPVRRGRGAVVAAK